jgi:hypothetical protein
MTLVRSHGFTPHCFPLSPHSVPHFQKHCVNVLRNPTATGVDELFLRLMPGMADESAVCAMNRHPLWRRYVLAGEIRCICVGAQCIAPPWRDDLRWWAVRILCTFDSSAHRKQSTHW